MNPDRREHFVYRAFDADGNLLYVGCTMDLERRRRDHAGLNGSKWYPLMVRTHLTGPFNYDTARRLERDAIQTESPLWNSMDPNRVALRALYQRMTNRWFRLEHDIQGRPSNWKSAFESAKAHVARLLPNSELDLYGRHIADGELAEAREVAAWDLETFNTKVRWINRKEVSA